MVNYQQSKIYRIRVHGSDEQYIGSTTKQYLCQRFGQHKSLFQQYLKGNYGRYSSFGLFEKYGIDNCYIELIEEYQCNSKDELRSREGYHIRQNMCVNRYVAGRTKTEYGATYRQNNQNKICERVAAYYNQNRDVILEKKSEPITCECGCSIRKGDIARHRRTQKHTTLMQSQQQQPVEISTDTI